MRENACGYGAGKSVATLRYMLQERAPLLGATVELVQSVTIAVLVLFLAVAVLAAALLGFAWGRAKIATEKLRAWYAEIATRRVMNDAKRSQRLPMPVQRAPDTLRSGSPLQPMKLASTPIPPPLPTIPIVAAPVAPGPPRPPRPKPSAVPALGQTSVDWSDDGRKTQRVPRPPRGDEVTEDDLDFSGPNEPPPRRR